MALRPAGKTLSSLTGLLVMAAVLWLLLNFVYAPSCGRFSCGYEPAWLPQAQADNGCPESIREAAQDRTWLHARLDSIEDEKVTAGILYDEDGMAHRFTSGRDDDSENALKVGRNSASSAVRDRTWWTMSRSRSRLQWLAGMSGTGYW